MHFDNLSATLQRAAESDIVCMECGAKFDDGVPFADATEIVDLERFDGPVSGFLCRADYLELLDGLTAPDGDA